MDFSDNYFKLYINDSLIMTLRIYEDTCIQKYDRKTKQTKKVSCIPVFAYIYIYIYIYIYMHIYIWKSSKFSRKHKTIISFITV